jgi:integrase
MTRFLDEDLWQVVQTTITSLPRESDRECGRYARARWLFSLLYGCGLRISEVAENTMGGFFAARTPNTKTRWLEIVGKGGKTRIVPVTRELLAELIHYRKAYGLAPLPPAGDATPLVLSITGKAKPLTRAALHGIVKQVFNAAAGRAALQGADAAHQVERLQSASAHWLRHTSGSRMADAQMDLRHIRDNLGHESLATTSGYLHSTDDVRHRETDAKLRLGW